MKSRIGKSSLASCIEFNGNRAHSPVAKADILNTFFHSVFNESVPEESLSPDFVNGFPVTDHTISDLYCNTEDVAKLLRSIDVNKACGPDSIPPRILKECSAVLASSFSSLPNYSLSMGRLPVDWKLANVVPVFKSGKNTLADNYRPVSLTSIIVKTLERLIHKHIMKFLMDLNLLCDNQHGFRQSRSCVTQLLQLLLDWFSTLDKQSSVDVIFFGLRQSVRQSLSYSSTRQLYNVMETKARYWVG